VDDLVLPLFVQEGEGKRDAIASMPGCHRFSMDQLVEEARKAAALGIPGVILFGLPASKDEEGRSGWDADGIVPRAIRALRVENVDLLVWADVCLCEYTSHGHCGPLCDDKSTVKNDETVERLVKQAVNHAKAGAAVIAPSGMMDGAVGALRDGLDAAGFVDVSILSYAVKYASAFYGPFRDAADSAPEFGDRRSYQMDPARGVEEALLEVDEDIDQGADMVMVKPALPYLDILSRVREEVDVPVVAYQVSGEYAMIEAAARNGWLDHDRAVLESLLAIKRAGADLIITYYAERLAKLLPVY
jgi:porphobilinogen synthase